MGIRLRRTTTAATAAATGLACLAVVAQGGQAAAAGAPGLYSAGQPLSGGVVPTTAPVELVDPQAASVSWVLDGEYLGRDTAAPFRLALAAPAGAHKLKARAETSQGSKTTFEVRFTTSVTTSSTPTSTPSPAPTSSSAPTPTTTPTPTPTATTTPAGRIRPVRTASELSSALGSARPGDVIELADGTYSGRFAAKVSGTATAPIVLRGGPRAVINAGATSTGIAVHLQGANHWRLQGFSVRGGQKGVVLDRSSSNVLSGLDVASMGMEGIHLRSASSDNRVERSAVHHTGVYEPGYGEGIYIGSATSNWSKYGAAGGPDRSDRNVLAGNRIWAVTAENIDVKEGTTGGQIVGNHLDGAGMTGVHFADSWIDLKGNGYRVTSNTGVNTRLDGFQTHVQLDGWGRDNVFSANVLQVGAAGYGVNVYRGDTGTRNVVHCDNVVTGAAAGLASVPCTR